MLRQLHSPLRLIPSALLKRRIRRRCHVPLSRRHRPHGRALGNCWNVTGRRPALGCEVPWQPNGCWLARRGRARRSRMRICACVSRCGRIREASRPACRWSWRTAGTRGRATSAMTWRSRSAVGSLSADGRRSPPPVPVAQGVLVGPGGASGPRGTRPGYARPPPARCRTTTATCLLRRHPGREDDRTWKARTGISWAGARWPPTCPRPADGPRSPRIRSGRSGIC